MEQGGEMGVGGHIAAWKPPPRVPDLALLTHKRGEIWVIHVCLITCKVIHDLYQLKIENTA